MEYNNSIVNPKYAINVKFSILTRLDKEDYPMTIGPLQILLVKFSDERRTKPIPEALKAVLKDGIIRLVDLLYVYKDMNGKLQLKEISDLIGQPKLNKVSYCKDYWVCVPPIRRVAISIRLQLQCPYL
jgi:hypothetical protein